ncbi:galactonate dehydratase [Leifsonia poae]|uniref:galactonate dehydratase n=1 Tax=Leifsonia poae TaxID=110933 RepID=UPI003D66CB1C
MKITALTTYLVEPRWLFLKVDTDTGPSGWGEPIVEGRAHTVRAAIDEMADYLVGTDPLRIEDTWQVLTKGGFYRGGPILSSAISGIDQALWDIYGKHVGLPVHQLLGGRVRDRIRTYSWIGGDHPQDVAAQAELRRDQGFTAVKMNASGRLTAHPSARELDEIVERVAAVSEVMGPHGGVAVDFHGRLSVAAARQLSKLLEPLRPMFIEEPVVPELGTTLGSIVANTAIPVATGERLYSRWDFRSVLEAGVSVVQPDLSHAGGISESRRIAAQAETYGAHIAPHCPLGPIAFAACLQLDLATPNFLIQETSLGIHYNVGADLTSYLVDPDAFQLRDGAIPAWEKPGLGVDIDEKAVAHAASRGHRWRSPTWRTDDGAFTEW